MAAHETRLEPCSRRRAALNSRDHAAQLAFSKMSRLRLAVVLALLVTL
jgi:hypothetical protein